MFPLLCLYPQNPELIRHCFMVCHACIVSFAVQRGMSCLCSRSLLRSPDSPRDSDADSTCITTPINQFGLFVCCSHLCVFEHLGVAYFIH